MSRNKILRRNRRKYDSLLRLAKSNDMSLAQCIDLLHRIKESKRADRLSKRHGDYVAWEKLEKDSEVFRSAPIYICGRNEVIGYRCILKKQDLPAEYQHLWEEK